MRLLLSLLACCLGDHASALESSPPSSSSEKTEPTSWTFQRDILPILSKNCFACHGPDEAERKAGLRLDTESGAVQKLESGSRAILPGNAQESELISRVTTPDETLRMPPPEHGPGLTPYQHNLLRVWIQSGAKYAQHWSFVPPVRPSLPTIRQSGWIRNPIDQFILAKLEEEGMAPSPEADRATLVRRLSLDLRGLPPTPAEVEQFQSDQSPQAYENLVNRMLDDPAFGERFGRMWLDLARYADSRGFGSDPLRPHIWRYRDWVIDAFNRNLPYDQFTIEQIAGDLLPNPTLDQLIATAFHRNTMTNTEGGTDDEEFRVAAVKDRAEVTMQVWMGLTLGCAQCHNHKYDPLSQKDYYQLTAFFNQTADFDQPDEQPTIPAPTPEMIQQNIEIDRQIEELKRTLDQTTPELELAQSQWEEKFRLSENWTLLKTTPITSTSDAQSEIHEWTSTPSPDGKLPNRIEAIRLSPAPAETTLLLEFAKETPVEPVRARFVRIELPGTQRILSLAEVEIFNGMKNLALAGKATQSSTGYSGTPERAIDGNTEGGFAQNSVTHTNEETSPWWEVDLGSAQVIDQIKVWNRRDGVSLRLDQFKITLLDDQRNVTWERRQIPAPESSHLQSVQTGLFELSPVPNLISGMNPEIRIFVLPTPWTPEQGNLNFKVRTTDPAPLSQLQFESIEKEVFTTRLTVSESTLKLIDLPRDQRSTEQQQALASVYRSLAPELQGVRDKIVQLEKSRPAVPSLPVMQELPADKLRTSFVMVKGNFLNRGEDVTPLFPTAFPATNASPSNNRLDLAHWLVSTSNPLTARVAVNRFWSLLFSRGLVETEEDFGTQGESPSHPELLDWLAVEFQQPEGGPENRSWDMKRLLRLMVTSATYRQGSQVTPAQLEKDPRNRWYGRGMRYRLEAELIRDQALALSGLLTRKIGGPSVFPPQPAGLWQAAFNGERSWETSLGSDRYRRGLYVFWRRTVPYPSMATFDAPSREICTIRRSRTNTPLQAFVTLNDPVYVEAAQGLARRILREGGTTPEDRARFGLQLCLVRTPTPEEVQTIVTLVNDEIEHYRSRAEEAQKIATEPLGPLDANLDLTETAAWTIAANVLLNLDGVLTRY